MIINSNFRCRRASASVSFGTVGLCGCIAAASSQSANLGMAPVCRLAPVPQFISRCQITRLLDPIQLIYTYPRSNTDPLYDSNVPEHSRKRRAIHVDPEAELMTGQPLSPDELKLSNKTDRKTVLPSTCADLPAQFKEI
ncbi:hypothetical protein J6590_100966 [Homalodisca vitripennis]|nr:hypothetical protein J6590_100966 [Homalodisca vitripennis]